MDVCNQLLDILARTERAVDQAASRALKAAGELGLEAAIETWPGPDRAETHPYQRNRSKKTWRLYTEAFNVLVIENTSGYSYYVELGYTRKGQGTARPWAVRGSVPYSLTSIGRAVTERFRQAFGIESLQWQ